MKQPNLVSKAFVLTVLVVAALLSSSCDSYGGMAVGVGAPTRWGGGSSAPRARRSSLADRRSKLRRPAPRGGSESHNESQRAACEIEGAGFASDVEVEEVHGFKRAGVAQVGANAGMGREEHEHATAKIPRRLVVAE